MRSVTVLQSGGPRPVSPPFICPPRQRRCQAPRRARIRVSRARIVAKIEKTQALDDLEAIVAESDAVMVARGDLGVEMDVARVPAAQKRVIAACSRARVPVITATHMR